MEVDAAGDLDLDNSSSEELFVFQNSVSTLQNIASHTVAVQLLHHYLNRAKCGKIQEIKAYGFFADVFNQGIDSEKESEDLVELLKTPQRIEEMLKKSVKKVYIKTGLWIYHFHHQIFRDVMSRYCVRDFDLNHIVWHQNDEIDYKRSVSNMLTEGKLKAEQKFVLMCSYGMAKELERFPINSLPEFFCLLGISDSIVGYWISYHRPDLHEMWLRMPEMIRTQDTSIHVTLAMECARARLSLPYAFEHFWSCLNEDEQTLIAVRILPQQWKLLKIMLSTMSSYRQLQLVDQIPVELMSTFFIDDYSAQFCRPTPENVLMVWALVKDQITELQFVQFLENVCYCAMKREEYMIVLIKVWDMAPDHLKRHIVEDHPSILFTSFMRCNEYSPSSYKFFMKFLPLVNERSRKELYLDLRAQEIASKCDIDILNLCLPEKADQLQLKNQIMETHDIVDYCAELLNVKKFDEVIALMTFFSRNPHDAREFFKKVLDSDRIDDKLFVLEYESWNKLSNFIDTVLTNDFSIISSLKKRLVSSFSVRSAVYDCNKKENVDALIQITEQVFSPEEVKSFKQTLLEHFQKQISLPMCFYFFKGKCFNTFVSWCSADENQIVDFRNIVPIDVFFDNIFRDVCSLPDDSLQYLLNTLNDFLNYVCAGNEEVELFKIRKYYERDRYWIRQVEQIFDVKTRRIILNWFLSVNA